MESFTILDITTETFNGRNVLNESKNRDLAAAKNALDTFYYALNNRDLALLDEVWHNNGLVQLNNPLGGILRGNNAVHDLYKRVVQGHVNVTVSFTDAIAYVSESTITFAGREKGQYVVEDTTHPLEIRTTRLFGYTPDGWRQLHHHGSIDDADLLARYKKAVLLS